MLAAAALALMLVSPWLIVVIARHGIHPFLNSMDTGVHLLDSIVDFVLFTLTGEPLFPVLAVLAVIGLGACWVRRQPLLPCWLVALYVVDLRAALTYGAVPLSILAGIGAGDILLPLLADPPWQQWRSSSSAASHPAEQRWLAIRAQQLLVLGLLLYTALGAVALAPSKMGVLSVDERTAMQWVAGSTPASSRFLIVGASTRESDPGWLSVADRTTEWFPALAGRTSVTTIQGREWLGTFRSGVQSWQDVLSCSDRGVDCLDAWAQKTSVAYTYVYLPKGTGQDSPDGQWCCWALRNSLRADERYVVVYDGAGATIFARRGA